MASTRQWMRQMREAKGLPPITRENTFYARGEKSISQRLSETPAAKPDPTVMSTPVLTTTTPTGRCVGCGAPASMSASLGAACPDCFDSLSG